MKKTAIHFKTLLFNAGFGILIIVGTRPQLILAPLEHIL